MLACAGVELGHQLAVGCPCRSEVVVAFFELEAEIGGLLFEIGDFLAERVDVRGGAESGFPPCLLTEGLGEPFLELLDAGGQPGCALMGGEQVGLQRFPCHGRPGCASGCCGRDGFEGVDLGEEVPVAVEESAVNRAARAMDDTLISVPSAEARLIAAMTRWRRRAESAWRPFLIAPVCGVLVTGVPGIRVRPAGWPACRG